MFGTFLLMNVRGVPIRIHFTALLLLPWFYRIVENFPFVKEPWALPATILLIVMLLGSVALHELGHTLVAQRYHMRVNDIILTPIGGVARLSGGLENPRHEIRVAVAGPYVSFLLAILGYLLSQALLVANAPIAATFAFIFFFLNAMLFLFNLLPSFPMDGGRVLRGWLAQKKGMLEATRIASSVGKYLAIAFMLIGFTTGRWSLLIIGFFIFLAAGSEYRMMQLKAWQEQQLGMRSDLDGMEPDVEVSPPPYASNRSRSTSSGLFSDLLIAGKDLFQETFQSAGGIKR